MPCRRAASPNAVHSSGAHPSPNLSMAAVPIPRFSR